MRRRQHLVQHTRHSVNEITTATDDIMSNMISKRSVLTEDERKVSAFDTNDDASAWSFELSCSSIE